VTGRLLPVGDTDAMANAAVELLTQPERLDEMGRAGRVSAQARYCASRIIPLYEKYYEAVLAREAG
jgi:L-malate glycosyltransferase